MTRGSMNLSQKDGGLPPDHVVQDEDTILRDSERVRNFTFQQWSQIGKRSLFDVMSAESDHFNLRISYVNALYDGYQATAQLRAMGSGLSAWVMPEQR